jgi:hypothetical protein
LEEGAKSSMGVDCQRDEDHVACEDLADYCVTNCNDACGWVGFVVASNLLFSYFCRCVSALVVNIVVTLGEVGLKEGDRCNVLT